MSVLGRDERAANVAALAIATHRISLPRARVIAADVIRELTRSGWGPRPDTIPLPIPAFTCAVGPCGGATAALRWDGRSKTWKPVCGDHSGADRPPGGTP